MNDSGSSSADGLLCPAAAGHARVPGFHMQTPTGCVLQVKLRAPGRIGPPDLLPNR